MSKTTVHRLIVVALLLAIFGLPFYVQKNSLRTWNDSSYTVGGAIGRGQAQQASAPSVVGPSNNQNAWNNTVGDSFVGASAAP